MKHLMSYIFIQYVLGTQFIFKIYKSRKITFQHGNQQNEFTL